jgi:hypothetical protein
MLSEHSTEFAEPMLNHPRYHPFHSHKLGIWAYVLSMFQFLPQLIAGHQTPITPLFLLCFTSVREMSSIECVFASSSLCACWVYKNHVRAPSLSNYSCHGWPFSSRASSFTQWVCVWLSRSWPLVSVPTHSGQVYVGPHHFSRRLLPFAHPRPVDGFKNRFLDMVLKPSLQNDLKGRFH